MVFFADASFVIARYVEGRFSTAARAVVQRHSPLIHLSGVTRLEVVTALARQSNPERLRGFRDDLTQGVKVRLATAASWAEGLQLAESWSVRVAPRLAIGATDTFVVALAFLGGATHFLSFDQGSNQRVMASLAGLTVLPEPSRHETSLARRL